MPTQQGWEKGLAWVTMNTLDEILEISHKTQPAHQTEVFFQYLDFTTLSVKENGMENDQ